jgi:hypothetical protein
VVRVLIYVGILLDARSEPGAVCSIRTDLALRLSDRCFVTEVYNSSGEKVLTFLASELAVVDEGFAELGFVARGRTK